MGKNCPKHVGLILEINKLLLLHLVGFSILLYLHWWCTVWHKWSNYCVVKDKEIDVCVLYKPYSKAVVRPSDRSNIV